MYIHHIFPDRSKLCPHSTQLLDSQAFVIFSQYKNACWSYWWSVWVWNNNNSNNKKKNAKLQLPLATTLKQDHVGISGCVRVSPSVRPCPAEADLPGLHPIPPNMPEDQNTSGFSISNHPEHQMSNKSPSKQNKEKEMLIELISFQQIT